MAKAIFGIFNLTGPIKKIAATLRIELLPSNRIVDLFHSSNVSSSYQARTTSPRLAACTLPWGMFPQRGKYLQSLIRRHFSSMARSKYVGINIQFPISKEILAGGKTIETRTYPIPPAYLGVTLLMVETPGKTGRFKSRIVARIRFSKCFLYRSKKQFYADSNKHRVTPESPWAWQDKPKWGWIIESVVPLAKPRPAGRIGIRYTKCLEI